MVRACEIVGSNEKLKKVQCSSVDTVLIYFLQKNCVCLHACVFINTYVGLNNFQIKACRVG